MRRSTVWICGNRRGGGGTGTIRVISFDVPWTSFWNFRLWLTSALTDALQQAKPTLASTLTLTLVSVDVVVLMSISTSIEASANWYKVGNRPTWINDILIASASLIVTVPSSAIVSVISGTTSILVLASSIAVFSELSSSARCAAAIPNASFATMSGSGTSRSS